MYRGYFGGILKQIGLGTPSFAPKLISSYQPGCEAKGLHIVSNVGVGLGTRVYY